MQIQIHEEDDHNKANIYHNGTIMFQGSEACLSSLQTNFNSLKLPPKAEKQTEGAYSHATRGYESPELRGAERTPNDWDSHLEQSVTQIRNSLSLQKLELVEILLSPTSSGRLQHLENKLYHLTQGDSD